jgi:hypothetical protein
VCPNPFNNETHAEVFLKENAKIQAGDRAVPVQVIFCLKEKNQKKINSHRFVVNSLVSTIPIRHFQMVFQRFWPYLGAQCLCPPRCGYYAWAPFYLPLVEGIRHQFECRWSLRRDRCSQGQILAQLAEPSWCGFPVIPSTARPSAKNN